MRNFKLVLIILLSLILFQCEKDDDNSISEYLTATIDGKEFIAEWNYVALSSPFYEENMYIHISASNYKSSTNSNKQHLSLTIVDTHLGTGIYKYDCYYSELSPDLTLLGYSYDAEEDDVTYALNTVDGFITIDKLEYKIGGIIKGEFEFEATDFIDTVSIKNGKFQLKFTN